MSDHQETLFDTAEEPAPPRASHRQHHCHWPGCKIRVAPKFWGCHAHWYALPKVLRDRIWLTYRPGQEVDMTPSEEYIAAARAVQAWIARHQERTTKHTEDTKGDGA